MAANSPCSKGCGRPATRRGWCSSHYSQQRERQIAYGRWQLLYTEAEPVRLHIKELAAAGLGLRTISQLSGVNRSILECIVNGRTDRGTPPSYRVLRANADRILAIPVPTSGHHRHVAAHRLVPALGTRRRLQALVAFGYLRRQLAERLGMDPSNLGRLFREDTTHVVALTARNIAALFEQLSAQPGPSERARNEGARRGWAVPMAWDDDAIDDPTATPEHGENSRPTFTEWYLELRNLGYRDSEIAARAGVEPASLARRINRHDIHSLAEAG